jgi:hypothetical protein
MNEGNSELAIMAVCQSQGGSLMKSALTLVLGVAAVAFIAAPLTSYAGGTIAGKVT